mmetsp:Transcript_26075/g.60144  ORF Transcript_26075/g.60144 Transcript_26075/m.60144 type:complete len:228 (-) Transcript_26075:1110-1793(-)
MVVAEYLLAQLRLEASEAADHRHGHTPGVVGRHAGELDVEDVANVARWLVSLDGPYNEATGVQGAPRGTARHWMHVGGVNGHTAAHADNAGRHSLKHNKVAGWFGALDGQHTGVGSNLVGNRVAATEQGVPLLAGVDIAQGVGHSRRLSLHSDFAHDADVVRRHALNPFHPEANLHPPDLVDCLPFQIDHVQKLGLLGLRVLLHLHVVGGHLAPCLVLPTPTVESAG